MERPGRIQLSRKKGYRKPEGAVVVSSPTKWGNPFDWREIAVQPGYETQKHIAMKEFEFWLTGRNPYGDMLPERRQWILDHVHELRGHDICCWCKPDEACHADVLLRLANVAG